MATVKHYQVVFDDDLDIVETKEMSVAESTQRVVAVIAPTPQEARKMARILIGKGTN